MHIIHFQVHPVAMKYEFAKHDLFADLCCDVSCIKF